MFDFYREWYRKLWHLLHIYEKIEAVKTDLQIITESQISASSDILRYAPNFHPNLTNLRFSSCHYHNSLKI